MGTGQSKNAPDEQMRMQMENGFDDDDVDIEALGLSERDKNTRSKSNLSFHTSERVKNADGEEYFNRIYNKTNEKSLSSQSNGGGSIGAKSAPAGSKKEKDPEVAAAIAELEETFKVLGDSEPVSTGEELVEKVEELQQFGNYDEMDTGYSDSLSIEVEELSSSPNHTDSTREQSDESGIDTRSESSPCQVPYDRQLITRAGETSHGTIHDSNGVPRRPGKFLEMNNRAIGTSGGFKSNTYNNSSGSSNSTIGSRGSEQRSLLSSSHANIKNGRNSSTLLSNSVLMQHRKDFQRKQATDQHFSQDSSKLNGESDGVTVQKKDWTYQPPKIDGFDIEKFKQVNSKGSTSTILPISLREEEDTGYCSRSPEIPAYTKDELALIASLERQVY